MTTDMSAAIKNVETRRKELYTANEEFSTAQFRLHYAQVNLDAANKALQELTKSCNHTWGEAVFTLGSSWQRICTHCGKMQETTATVMKSVPVFNNEVES